MFLVHHIPDVILIRFNFNIRISCSFSKVRAQTPLHSLCTTDTLQAYFLTLSICSFPFRISHFSHWALSFVTWSKHLSCQQYSMHDKSSKRIPKFVKITHGIDDSPAWVRPWANNFAVWSALSADLRSGSIISGLAAQREQSTILCSFTVK